MRSIESFNRGETENMPEPFVDVNLVLEKSTKGTHVYAEKTQGTPPKIRSLYLPRWVFPDGDNPPTQIHVSVFNGSE